METSGLNIDTAAMFIDHAPWAPEDDDKTRSRTHIVEAHRRYLELMHHIPLVIDSRDFHYVVKSIHTLVCVADAYDSLSVISTPIESFLILHHRLDIGEPFERFSDVNYKELLIIAMKIRSRWLLKEIVCRLIADPLWEDDDIERDFSSSGAGELLLDKRAELRNMLKDIDQRVMLIQQPRKTRTMHDDRTLAFATAAFRNEISRLFNSHRKGDWVSYARKYRLLKERLLQNIGSGWPNSWIDRLYSKFGRPAALSREEFVTVIRSLQTRTAEIIEPLFDCVVQRPSVKPSRRNASCEGFLCINVTDDDIPWKEKGHHMPLGKGAFMEVSESSDEEA